MKHKFLYNWIIAIVFSFGIIGAPEVVYSETVKVGGTGFGLGSMRMLAEFFEKQHPGVKIEVFPSLGSSGGIKAVLKGALDLGLSARPLKEAEMNMGGIAREIARTPFAIFANSSIKKDGLTFQELEDIYGGRLLSWPDGTRIRLVLRPKEETDTKIVRKLSPAMDRAVASALNREGMIRTITDQENASAVEKAKGALGCGTLAQILSENRQVKILSLNGVKPSVEGIANGSYRWFKILYLVTTIKTQPAVQKFLEFIDSETGGRILNKYGWMILPPPDGDQR